MADYTDIYQEAANRWNVDPLLLRALSIVESGENPAATSPAGAEGQTQFMPPTAREVGVGNTRNPGEAINGTAKLLDTYLKQTNGDVTTALRMYQGGPDQSKWGPQNAAYAGKVAAVYQKLLAQNGGKSPAIEGTFNPSTMSDKDLDAYLSGGGNKAAPAPQSAPEAAPTTEPSIAAAPPAPSPSSGPDIGSMSDQDLDKFLSTAPEKAPEATPETPPKPTPGIGEQLVQGARSVIDPLAEGLASGATYLANKVGLERVPGAPTGAETAAGDEAARQAYKAQGGTTSSIPYILGQGGAILGTTMAVNPLIRGAVAPVAAGIGRFAPAAESAVNGATNLLTGGSAPSGGLISRIGQGAAQGATLGAEGNLLAAGGSDQTAGERAVNGAVSGAALGGAIPLALGGGSFLKNGATNAFNFLVPTEGSNSRLANGLISRFAGDQPLSLDTREIVPGSQPTLAEASGNAGVAQLQKGLKESEPLDNNRFTVREQQNSSARSAAAEGASGTPADLETAQATRQAITPDNLFANKQPTNAQPVVDKIDEILAGSGGGRTAVQSSLQKLRGTLYDSDGNLVTDPEYLYNSVRKQIGDQLDNANLSDPSGKQSARELLAVRDELDNAIENGVASRDAQGNITGNSFKKYLNDYSTASQPIDAMKFLQGLNLTDATGNITLPKVQNALTNLQKQRSLPGPRTAKSVSDDQIAALEGIRDDLLRRSNQDLGNARGSPSVQNLATQSLMSGVVPSPVARAFGYLDPRVTGGAAGAYLGNLAAGPVGGAVGSGIGTLGGQLVRDFAAARNAAVRNKLTDIMLNPSQYQPPAANPLSSRVGNALAGSAPFLIPAATPDLPTIVVRPSRAPAPAE